MKPESSASSEAVKKEKRDVVLQIGAQSTSIRYPDTKGLQRTADFQLGYEQLATEVLRHAPPTPAELERAIALIEDELMKLHRLIPETAALVTTDTHIADLVRMIHPEIQSSIMASIEEVEQLFDLLAALSLGRPATSAGVPSDVRFAAILLILREVMHHLRFRSIQILHS